MNKPDYVEFISLVEKRDFGRMFYNVVFVPPKIEQRLNLKDHPRLRLKGTVAGVPFSGAVQPNKINWYLILSKRLLKDAGSPLGDSVIVRLKVSNQDAVEVPGDLMKEIQRRPVLFSAWEGLSSGRKRSLAYRASSSKRMETRERRILEVIETIMDEE